MYLKDINLCTGEQQVMGNTILIAFKRLLLSKTRNWKFLNVKL